MRSGPRSGWRQPRRPTEQEAERGRRPRGESDELLAVRRDRHAAVGARERRRGKDHARRRDLDRRGAASDADRDDHLHSNRNG